MTDPRLVRPAWRGRTNVDALTISCIERAEEWAGHVFVVTQGSYQSGHGDLNSAGTHDGGGVVDLAWCGHPDCILHLRKAGMFAYHRTPRQGPWPDHIHAGVLGHPLLSPAAKQQETSYLNRGNGLAKGGPDDGPWLNPIPYPVWPPVDLALQRKRRRRAKARKKIKNTLAFMEKHKIPGQGLLRKALKKTHQDRP